MQDGVRVAIETMIDRQRRFPASPRAVVLCDAIQCMYMMQNGLDCGRGPCWRARK